MEKILVYFMSTQQNKQYNLESLLVNVNKCNCAWCV